MENKSILHKYQVVSFFILAFLIGAVFMVIVFVTGIRVARAKFPDLKEESKRN